MYKIHIGPYGWPPGPAGAPVLAQDARPLPEVTISKKRRQARPSTYRTAVLTHPDGTIGRLGTLSVFSRIHRPSIFGIDEITTDLIEAESCDINQNEGMGSTPPVGAVWNGHVGVVKMQLGLDKMNSDT